jgi:hypothetical protein
LNTIRKVEEETKVQVRQHFHVVKISVPRLSGSVVGNLPASLREVRYTHNKHSQFVCAKMAQNGTVERVTF